MSDTPVPVRPPDAVEVILDYSEENKRMDIQIEYLNGSENGHVTSGNFSILIDNEEIYSFSGDDWTTIQEVVVNEYAVTYNESKISFILLENLNPSALKAGQTFTFQFLGLDTYSCSPVSESYSVPYPVVSDYDAYLFIDDSFVKLNTDLTSVESRLSSLENSINGLEEDMLS